MVGLYLLDKRPTWPKFRAHMDQASRRFPRLRERVVEATTTLVDARWVTDPDFDLDYHVRRVGLARPGAVPPSARPRRDLTDGPARHRSSAVGVHARRRGRAGSRRTDHEAQPRHHRWSRRHGAAVGAVRHRARGARPTARARADPDRSDTERHHAASAAPAPRHPDRIRWEHRRQRRRHRRAGVVPASASRHTNDGIPQLAAARHRHAGATDSAPRRPEQLRRVLWTEVPLDDLKRAAKSVGGTINDAYLAALAGALARYHDRLGVPVAAVSVAVPINRRTEGTDAGREPMERRVHRPSHQ